jgi:hypothetical protein
LEKGGVGRRSWKEELEGGGVGRRRSWKEEFERRGVEKRRSWEELEELERRSVEVGGVRRRRS